MSSRLRAAFSLPIGQELFPEKSKDNPMLPARYGWLAREPGPKMLIEALKLYGTLESPGSKNNPTIIAWAKEVGGEVADVYAADSIPWCGLFMAVIAKRAGKDLPVHPLWALS